jgi:hypothetical protein
MKHSNYDSTDEYQEQQLPIDKHDHHIFFEPLKSLKDNTALINSYLYCIDDGKKGRQPSQELSLKKHLELFLYNITAANEQHKWLCIELTKCKFAKNTWYSNIGLKRTHIKVVIEGMLRNDLITKKEPVNFPGHSKVTRYFPTQKLIDSLENVVDYLEYPFIEPYVRVNDIEPEYETVFEQIQQPDSNHPDVTNLRKINNFLIEHTWPRKGPIKLIYKGNPFNGGRVYTPFQNIKNNEVRYRLNSLIDGQPIVEIDFSANHLRLSLAIFSKVDIGPEDPYIKIASSIGEDRDSVKKLITHCLGSSTQQKAFQSLYQEGFSNERSQKIVDQVYSLYPEIELFDVGVKLQSVEGSIMMNMCLQGVEDGIVVLPIHDGVAIQRKHQEWGIKFMKQYWEDAVQHTAKAVVTVKEP